MPPPGSGPISRPGMDGCDLDEAAGLACNRMTEAPPPVPEGPAGPPPRLAEARPRHPRGLVIGHDGTPPGLASHHRGRTGTVQIGHDDILRSLIDERIILVRSPVARSENGRRRLPGYGASTKRTPQALAPVRRQLVHVHRLHRPCTVLVAVLAAPPRRAPDANEVRCLEAGPVPVGLDKRLHQPRAIAVASLEIFPQAAQHTAQHMAREVTATHPGTDQKPAQAHHTVQMGSTLLVAPRHPRVARADVAPTRTPPTLPAPHATRR